MARPVLPLPPLPPRGARLVPAVHWRIVVVWLVLVVAFTGGFLSLRFADGLPGLARQGLAVLAPLVAGVVLFLGFLLSARRAARRNQAGIDRLAAGDYDAAAAAFREVARKVGFGAPASYNLGLTLLRMADVRGALGAFAAAERAGGGRGRGVLGAAGAGAISLCWALLGELDASEAWSTEARRRHVRPGHASRLHFVAEAIAHQRRGRDEAAARRFAESWAEIELTTSADLMRGIRVVRAFVVERAGGSPGEVEALLAGARPFRKGDYAWLYGAWKELEVWAAVKGFVTA